MRRPNDHLLKWSHNWLVLMIIESHTNNSFNSAKATDPSIRSEEGDYMTPYMAIRSRSSHFWEGVVLSCFVSFDY